MKRIILFGFLSGFLIFNSVTPSVATAAYARLEMSKQNMISQEVTKVQLVQINILSPTGGEWKRGATMPIVFSVSNGVINWVNIYVKKGMDVFYSFTHIAADRNPNKITYSWTIPKDAPIGKDYTIEIVSEQNSAIRKKSAPFSIILPTIAAANQGGSQTTTAAKTHLGAVTFNNINVTSPDKGDHWTIPSDQPIPVKWEHPSFKNLNSVNIKLLKADGTLLKALAAGIPYNTGLYNWKPTGNDIKPGEYRIQVTAVEDVDVQGTSESFFLDAPLTHMTITFPAPNSLLMIGCRYDFTWTYDGSNNQIIEIMDDDGVIADNVPINAGNLGPGKGTYNILIQKKYGGKNTTIHLRTQYSNVDNASVTFGSSWPLLKMTHPYNEENWAPYSEHEIFWKWAGCGDEILTITIDFIDEGVPIPENANEALHPIGTAKASSGSFMMNMDAVRKYMSDTGKNLVKFHIRIYDPYGGSIISPWITCKL